MPAALPPLNELERLQALLRLAVLDTPPEPAFDCVTRLASELLAAPIALVSLVDAERQWFKSCVGLPVLQTPRSQAFCAHAILSTEPLVVPDAEADPRFADNPLVTGPPHIRAYLGAPLIDAQGLGLGTLCVIDLVSRDWTEAEIARLQGLSAIVMEVLRAKSLGETARLQAAEIEELKYRLDDAQAFAETVSEMTGVGGWRLEVSTMTPVWSSQVRRIHEVPRDFDPAIDSAIEFYSPEARLKVAQSIEDAIEGHIPFDFELPFTTATGRARWVRSIGRPILRAGRVTHIVGSFQDVTERRQVLAELEAARLRAEAANQAKGAFLANMSHEIRTPLNGVIGLADALSRTELSPHQAEMTALILQSGEVLERLLTDVLDASKLEAGKLALVTAPIDLGHAIDTAAQLMRVRADNKGLRFSVDLDPRIEGRHWGDAVRVKQIVSNLVSNAIKFTETGSVRVIVQLAADQPDQGVDHVVIRVRDTGVGFDEATAQRLFQRFEQAGAGAAGQHGGTGLGLAICRELTQLMGGSIEARSTPNVGSVFEVRLPFKRAEADRRSAARAKAEPTELGLRVLLVDDNPINQRVASIMLEAIGARVTIVSNGREALEAHAGCDFDIILIDRNMPVMNGLEAVRQIRATETEAQRQRTPIAVVSADDEAPAQAEAREAGADGFIAKPITPTSLTLGLGETIAAARAAYESRSAAA